MWISITKLSLINRRKLFFNLPLFLQTILLKARKLLFQFLKGIFDVITKTYLYNFDPLKPHFYIVKLGFTEVYIIFLITVQKDRLWVLIRTASNHGSKEYPQSMFCVEI